MGALLVAGCYTTASPVGLHVFDVDASAGDLSTRSQLAIENASFLAAAPDGSTLYAVRETIDSGAVIALRLTDGSLTPIDEVSSHGSAPCHVSTDGARVFVANYGSGTVAAYAVRPDGTFGDCLGHHRHEGSGPLPRQEAPHAHCIVSSPDGVSAYATDLGTDRIVRYAFDAGEDSNGLRHVGETVMPSGSGPRHLTFHPTQPVGFAVCELDNTLVVLDVDPDTGELHPGATVSTLPGDAAGESIAAEVCVHPDGRRVYVSNRGHDSIATYAYEASDPSLQLLGHVPSGGRTPRHFAIHPSGDTMFVANQDSDTIVAFALDDDSAIPRPLGVAAEVSQPVCLTFVEVDQ